MGYTWIIVASSGVAVSQPARRGCLRSRPERLGSGTASVSVLARFGARALLLVTIPAVGSASETCEFWCGTTKTPLSLIFAPVSVTVTGNVANSDLVVRLHSGGW